MQYRQTYANRYPLRARIQTGIAIAGLLLVFLPVLPSIQINIVPPAQAEMQEGQ